jgi:hypothetical protein
LTDGLVASDEDVVAVTRLLGRAPRCRFKVVVRRPDGDPVVILNAPRMDDGTPMPTMLWLVDPELSRQVGGIESGGGVRRIEALVDPAEIEAVHADYARRRQELETDGDGPTATGGVGGTRIGVKCLHAHLANFLAGAPDPVGRLTAAELELGELVPEPPSRERLS